MIPNGFADVPPDASGHGIDLNKEAIKEMMPNKGKKYFEPTPEWDRSGMSCDKPWIQKSDNFKKEAVLSFETASFYYLLPTTYYD